MNIAYTQDAKHAVDSLNSEIQKIQVMNIFNSICEWKSTIEDEALWCAADDAIEAYAKHLVKEFNFSRRDIAPYAA